MEVNENKIKWSMSVFKLHKITHSIEKFKIGILKKKMSRIISVTQLF